MEKDVIRIKHVIKSPCTTCARKTYCEMGGRECGKFRDWFSTEWPIVTKSIKGDGHNYFIFRLIKNP